MSPKISRLLWLAAFLAALAWYGVFRVNAIARHEPFTPGFSGNDFKHIYMGPWMLARGDNPYDEDALRRHITARGMGGGNPYVYPPFCGLLLRPLTWMDPPTSARAWFWLNHAFLAGGLALSFAGLGLRVSPRNLALAASLAAFCYPWHRTLTAGQLNGLLFLAFAAVYYFCRRRWAWLAGGLAALAAWVKLIPGVLLLYFLWSPRGGGTLARRRNRLWAAGGMTAAGFALGLFALAAVGMRPHWQYLDVLGEMGYGRSTSAEFGEAFYRAPENQSFNAFWHRVLAPAEGFEPWLEAGPGVADLLTVACVLALLVLVLWRLRPWKYEPQINEAPAFGLFLMLGLLVPSLYWDHYAVLTLWPLLALAGRMPEALRGGAWGVFVLWALPLGGFLELPVWLSLSMVAFGLALGGWLRRRHGRRAWFGLLWALSAALLVARFPFQWQPFFSGLGLLGMSIKLWGSLLLTALLLWEARDAPERPLGR